MASRRISAEEKQWQAQEDLRTLTRAAEIQKDRSRMTAVSKHATAQVKTLQSVTGVKPTAKKR